MRVSEFAKELGKSSKEVLEILQKNNFDVKSHASNVSDDQMGLETYTTLDGSWTDEDGIQHNAFEARR